MPRVLETHQLSLIIHTEDEDAYLDSYTLVEPQDAASGNWEVWSIEAEGSDEVENFEDVEFVPNNLLFEIQSEADLSLDAVHCILSSFELGRDFGEKLGKRTVQKSVKFAITSLTGEIDGSDLFEAAEGYYHRHPKK